MAKTKSKSSKESPKHKEKTVQTTQQSAENVNSKHSPASKKSTISKKSKKEAPTQDAQTQQTQTQADMTQKTELAPPDANRFEEMKRLALEIQKQQIKNALEDKVVDLEFDKTQWELTKWATYDEEQKQKKKEAEAAPPGTPAPMTGEPPVQAISNDPVPGETKQEVGEQGDYLNETPKVSLIIEGVEIFLIFLTFVLGGVASGFSKIEVWFALINLLIALGLLVFTLVAHVKRLEVDSLETVQKTTRYFIKGCYKKVYFNFAFWRLPLHFATFVILIYFGNCGDEKANFHVPGYCTETSAAKGLYISAGIFALLNMIGPIIHLHYMKKNVFAIITFAGSE
uniref:Uncharacterized protein n=1 Tax=Panagrolaimus sp. JU765 TaxID=591449 RepID=A0AC34RHW5_9BILA